jgi:hypothetical protein
MKTIKTNYATGIAALALLSLSLIVSMAVKAAPPLPGAIFTTDSTCSGVDLNIYLSKSDVYLDGGPAHPGAASLPDGSYYVQVTDPSGACVLGTSVGSGNPTPFVVSGGVAACLQLCTLTNGPTGDGSIGNCPTSVDPTCGYNDTTNPGGEYKVWVSTVSTFDNNSTKTDNFKVKPSTACVPTTTPCPTPTPACETTICVNKFYDANANGTQDAGEVNIVGWRYCVVGSNNFSNTRFTFDPPRCLVVDPDTYTVYEDTPVETNWVHTTATSFQFTLAECDTHNVSFGNVCLGPGGGLTLGFWSNKNGQKLETAADFTFLNTLCLRNANGSDKDFTSTLANNKTALNAWLLAGNAVNMAYMLSVQLTAMELNVRHGFVSGSSLVYAPCLIGTGTPGVSGLGFISINDLMTAANASLCAHGSTPSGDPNRAYQECLKNTLDDANNNKNFVQGSPCPFSFGTDTCPFTNP